MEAHFVRSQHKVPGLQQCSPPESDALQQVAPAGQHPSSQHFWQHSQVLVLETSQQSGSLAGQQPPPALFKGQQVSVTSQQIM
jgi:hypothetical protein